MKNRSGIELVMLILAIAVGSMLVVFTLGFFIFKMLNPTASIEIPAGFYDIIKLVLSGLIGYVAGRGLRGTKVDENESNSPTAIPTKRNR